MKNQIASTVNKLSVTEDQALFENKDFSTVLITAFHQYPSAMAAFLEIVTSEIKSGNRVLIGLWANQTFVSDTCSLTSPLLLSAFRKTSVQDDVREYLENLSSEYENLRFVNLTDKRGKRWHFGRGKKIKIKDIQNLVGEFNGQGYAIGASLIDGTRRSLETASFRRSIVELFSSSYVRVVNQLETLIVNENIEKVILFNGRRVHDHAILAATEKTQISAEIYELGATNLHYDLYSHGTHDRQALQQRMSKQFALAISEDETNARSLANEWFLARQRRGPLGTNSFVDRQLLGLSFDKKSAVNDVTFFASSLDELASIGPEWESDFKSQENAISQLKICLDHIGGYRLIVREHPFMAHMERSSLKDWRKFLANLGSNVLVVQAGSQMDTYKMITDSDLVVTYGSTAGIEAAFMGRPSLLLAPSFYDDLGVSQMARNPTQIIEWLSDPKLLPSAQLGCLTYGYFMANRGKEMNDVEMTSPLSFIYQGRSFGPSSRTIQRILAIENRIRRFFW
jgi:hypothetical protein